MEQSGITSKVGQGRDDGQQHVLSQVLDVRMGTPQERGERSKHSGRQLGHDLGNRVGLALLSA
jgi:hypothetical protein